MPKLPEDKPHIERFGVDGLTDLNYLQIQDRFRAFRELSRFDEE